MRATIGAHIACGLAAILIAGCGGKDKDNTQPPGTTPGALDGEAAAPALKVDKGVDLATKTIRVGALNDESGPAATIGKPYALGKRVLAAEVNAGGSDILPEGWRVEVVERDHGYNPQKSVAAYNEIKADVLFIATSFGTPNTLPLTPHLQRDKMVAYPASLSSQMAANEFTPPAGPSYKLEARRAVDWIADGAEDKAAVKLGVVYQQDDYGADGLAGVEEQATKQGLTVVAKETVSPGQQDFTAVVTALQDKGATHVLLTTLPSATGPILGTALQHGFTPVWVGLTPSWVDAFFNPKVIPAAVFGSFYWVTGLPYWGEEGVDGMDAFLEVFAKHGGEGAQPDFYTLVSYLQGKLALAAAKRAIEAGDITRSGYLAGLHELDGWTAGGMMQEMSFSKVPYVVATKTRVLQPDLAGRTWKEIAPYAEPK